MTYHTKINHNRTRFVTYHDLDFRKVPMCWRSSSGQYHLRWTDIGMPKIPDAVLHCAPYLYKSENDARAGKNPGGTGFLITYPSKDGRFSHHYCVSAHHVVTKAGASCIRLIRNDGELEIFALDNSEWHFLPDTDISIVPLDFFRVQALQNRFIGHDLIFGNEKIAEQEIGPGDDVFMIGLFLDVQAAETELPAARFGNISTSPVNAPIHPYGDKVYCIDMHSRTGYSGSPVFIFRSPGSNLDWVVNKQHVFNPTLFGLLGVHSGQFPDVSPIVRQDKAGVIVGTDHEEYVKGLSGMNMVVPSQRILDLLDMKKIREMRDSEAELILASSHQLPDPSVLESAPEMDRQRGDELLKAMLNTPPKPTKQLHKK